MMEPRVHSSQELKSVSLQLRNLVSRTLRSHGDDARVNIRRLLQFVQDTPMLRDAVAAAPPPREAPEQIWARTRQGRNRLAIPDDVQEELGLLHALLCEFAKPTDQEFWNICYMYGNTHGLQECVKEVLHDVAGRYGEQLRNTVELALLQSGDPVYGNRQLAIHLTGGTNQVNVAQDSGTVEAAQTVGADAVRIVRAAEELFRAASAHEGADAAEIAEAAEAIRDTMGLATPRRFTLRAAKEKLELLAGATTAVATLAPQAQQLVTLIADWISRHPV